MPNTNSAKKALKQDAKKNARNRAKKKAIKELKKEIMTALEAGDRKLVDELLPKFYKAVD